MINDGDYVAQQSLKRTAAETSAANRKAMLGSAEGAIFFGAKPKESLTILLRNTPIIAVNGRMSCLEQ
jgi:hypothetical protein